MVHMQEKEDMNFRINLALEVALRKGARQGDTIFARLFGVNLDIMFIMADSGR